MELTILLTGGCGFVGIAVAEKLLAAGYRVVVFDLNPLKDKLGQYLAGIGGDRFSYSQGNVLDKTQVRQTATQHDVDVIFHAAAVTPDKERETCHGLSIINVNCGGMVNVMEVAEEVGIASFIYLSTGAVYGKGQWQQAELFEERTPEDPETYYEVTKFA